MKKFLIGCIASLLIIPAFFTGLNGSSQSYAQDTDPKPTYIKPPVQAKEDNQKGKFQSSSSTRMSGQSEELTLTEKKERNENIKLDLREMVQNGASQSEINNKLKDKYGLIPWVKVEKDSKQNLTAKLSGLFGGDTVEASSTASVSVDTPTAWYDTRTGENKVYAHFEWNGSSSWDSGDSDYDVGGKDAFAIDFDQHIQFESYEMTTFDTDHNEILSYTSPQKLTNYGVGYVQQDEILPNYNSDGGMYSWHEGEIFATFDVTTYEQHAVRSKLAHTWTSGSSVGVSSIGLGKGSISIGWTSSTATSKWSAYSEGQDLYNL
ncbi:hypothetical protein GLW08_21460 [Pontibacillus yanchengensis]|uniref:Uncharacterized protein n=1 Tax=Pontibacillus yanchengensis TaxID=462910 RepID=A0ACC7VM01_9BACI|nr:hypothetical protein [Pontibacillus yanchengensis]MYL55872.1 hypothetical protein [Pontibacillus yanchengensis]